MGPAPKAIRHGARYVAVRIIKKKISQRVRVNVLSLCWRLPGSGMSVSVCLGSSSLGLDTACRAEPRRVKNNCVGVHHGTAGLRVTRCPRPVRQVLAAHEVSWGGNTQPRARSDASEGRQVMLDPN